MAITVTLTSTQAALLSMTVLVLNNASAEGAWNANTSDINATVTPGSTGSMIVGASAGHFTGTPGSSYFTPETGTTFIQDSETTFHEGGGWYCPALTTAGVAVTGGAASSGLYPDACAVAVEILPAGGGSISLDGSAPPPQPASGQNTQLGVGGAVTSRVSASFTPPPGALLIVLATNTYGVGSTFLASESSGTYTWTRDAQASCSTDVAQVLIGVPPAPPPSGTGTATISLSGTATGSKNASGGGTAHLALSESGTGQHAGHGGATGHLALAGTATGHKAAHGGGTAHLALASHPGGAKHTSGGASASVAISALGASLNGPTVTLGTMTLMICLAPVLERQTQTERWPDVHAGELFWSRPELVDGLIAAGLALPAPPGVNWPPVMPPWTVHGTPGLGMGASNASATVG